MVYARESLRPQSPLGYDRYRCERGYHEESHRHASSDIVGTAYEREEIGLRSREHGYERESAIPDDAQVARSGLGIGSTPGEAEYPVEREEKQDGRGVQERKEGVMEVDLGECRVGIAPLRERLENEKRERAHAYEHYERPHEERGYSFHGPCFRGFETSPL